MTFLRPALRLTTGAATAVTLAFTARRWLYTLAARPQPPPPEPATLPGVLLIVSFYNEAADLPPLLDALNALDYPTDRLIIILVDDGSTDGSPDIAARWTAAHPGRHLLTLPTNGGKAAALNTALAAQLAGEWIAVFDADSRPVPDALRRLAAYTQPGVALVAGRRIVTNPDAGPAAAYAAVESAVHQQMTQRARDRLNLMPASLGANCLYRRTALTAVGLFRPGAILEDSDITVRLAQAGWRSRFAPDALSYHVAPATLPGYWRQHRRWAAGFNSVSRQSLWQLLRDGRLPHRLRLDLALFSLGYLDRVALLGALAAARRSPLARATVALALMTPASQILLALRADSVPLRRATAVPLIFAVDVAGALAALWRR